MCSIHLITSIGGDSGVWIQDIGGIIIRGFVIPAQGGGIRVLAEAIDHYIDLRKKQILQVYIPINEVKGKKRVKSKRQIL